MRTFSNYLLVGVVASVPAVFVASAQTGAATARATGAAATPNTWAKEYAEGSTFPCRARRPLSRLLL